MADQSVVQYVEGAKKQAQIIGSKLEDFFRSRKGFQEAVSAAFASVDIRGTGKLTLDQAASACVEFFKDISASLDDFGIKVTEPSTGEVKKILKDSGYQDGDTLNRQEFEELYAAILKYAALKCAYGFTQKYGIGIAIGYVTVGTFKHLLGKLPGSLGESVRKTLRWAPTIIVGPVLGVFGVWARDRGDFGAIKRKLFPEAGPKNQFKTG